MSFPTDQLQHQRLKQGINFQIETPVPLEWNRYTLRLPGRSDGDQPLRIIHLTDLHAGPEWLEGYDAILAAVRESKPDLILFTGDFVDKRAHFPDAAVTARRFFNQLSAGLGVWAVLGNHDPVELGDMLGDWGVQHLRQRHVVIDAGARKIELIGLPGNSREDLSYEFLESLSPQSPRHADHVRIVLAHFPDLIDAAAELKPDIFLAGHTHGGQICLPGRIPILRHAMLARKLCSGVHRHRDAWLVVNRGIGFTGVSLRLFCPSEVIELLI